MLDEARPQIHGQGPKAYASLVTAGDKLYAVTREGGTLVFAAGEKLDGPAYNDLGDAAVFNATPAFFAGTLHLRSDEYLYCIGRR